MSVYMVTRNSEYNKYLPPFRQGEEKAYDFFFRQYYTSLCFFANRLLNNQTDAEDIVQDCFTKLWSRRTSFDKSETIRSFLYSTVKNACIDRLRKNQSHELSRNGFIYLNESAEQSCLEGITRAETLREIYTLINHLPTRMQQVFRMFYIDGMNYAEIASYFKTSPETVRKQKAKALSLLREKFIFFLLLIAFI
jgi:RNA polymerase sigma-70 factor (family 1)